MPPELYSLQADGHASKDHSCQGRPLDATFVEDNYYCESGNPEDTFEHGCIYTDDQLWDGQQCEGVCYSNGKSPPWFSVELPNPTTDDIEVRICIAESTYIDDVFIQLLEL
jgi:hypothetical protein